MLKNSKGTISTSEIERRERNINIEEDWNI